MFPSSHWEFIVQTNGAIAIVTVRYSSAAVNMKLAVPLAPIPV